MKGININPRRVASSLGGLACALGVVVIVGWLLRISILLRINPQWPAMALYTAIALVLCGALLMLPEFLDELRLRRARALGAALLIGYSAIALTETLLLIDLGIEPHGLHRAFNPGFRWPGRMSPSTALCFLLLGAVFLLLNYLRREKGLRAAELPPQGNSQSAGAARSDRVAIAIRTLLRIELLICGIGLIGYLGRVEFLYSWGGITTMAMHTASGLVLVGAGAWWAMLAEQERDDAPVARIIRIATALLVMVGIITGFASFALAQRQTELNIANEMALRAEDKRRLVATVIENRTQRAATASYLLGASDALDKLAKNPRDSAAADALGAIATGLRRNGFSAIVFQDIHGQRRLLSGAAVVQPELSAPINTGYPAELLWSDGYLLRTQIPVHGANGLLGIFIGEQPLTVLTETATDFERWGSSGDMVICARASDRLACFPERVNKHPFELSGDIDGQALPMAHALSGANGQTMAMDFRRTRVFADYGPVGNLGLGLVIKMDADELYAPIRRQFLLSVPLISLLILIGLWLIQRNIQPLVKQLRDSGEAVRANEARFIAATENSLDAFAILESVRDSAGKIIDFRYVYINSNAAHMLRMTKEDAIGKQLGHLIPKEWPPYLELYSRVVETGEPYIGEVLDETRLPEEFWVRIQTVKLADSIAVTTTDITASRLATKALHEMAALQRAILESAGSAIIATTPQGVITLFNPAAERLLGYSADEVIGAHTPALFHDAEQIAQHSRALAEQSGRSMAEVGFEVFAGKARAGVSNTSEWTFVRKDGSRLPVLLTVTALRSPDQSVMGFLGIAVDITERKLADARFRLAVESAPTAIVIADAGGIITMANTEAARMFGYQPQEMLGLTVESLVPSARRQQHIAQRNDFHARLLSRRMGNGRELFAVRKDGSEFPVEIGLSPFDTSNGREVMATILDITARKRAETLLTESEEASRRAKEAAEAANAAKSSFLAVMSHEIRTPMNVILGMSRLARMQNLTPVVGDYLSKIEESTKGLLGIINDVLDYSKIEAGSVDIEMAPFALRDVIDSVQSLIVGLKRPRVGFALRVDTGVPQFLLGDRLRVQQLLTNLLSNAFKFTEHGQVELDIAQVERNATHSTLRFSVRDSGIGITGEQLQTLFQPFRQADSSTARRYGGTGLGLVICKRMAELMGGNIEARSEFGHGSQFCVTLPFAVVDALPAAANATPAPSNEIAKLRGLRVLIAEDHALNQQVIEELLSAYGLAVTLVDDGAAAVKLATPRDFDLVLMDLQMPVMDGLQATRAIRERFAAHELPIIAMTADAFSDVRDQCYAVGMNDHVTKPFELDSLIAVLLHWSGRDGDVPRASSAFARPPAQPAPAIPLTAAAASEELPLLDSAGVQERMGYGEVDYYKLLAMFRAEYENAPPLQLDPDDPAKLKFAAHTLKGVAQNIGLLRLGESASILHAALKAGESEVAEKIERLNLVLAETLAAIRRVLN